MALPLSFPLNMRCFEKSLKNAFLLGIIFFLILFTGGVVFAIKMTYESYIATESSKLEFLGDFPGGQFGASLASGDFNGDGIDDLAIGAPFASQPKRQWNGAVRIIFGGDNKPEAGYIYGKESGDQLGTSLAVGDFNSDGIDDLAIGGHKSLYQGERSGTAYLVYGDSHLDISVSTSIENAADWKISRGLEGSGFGIVMSKFDVNSDGIDDLLVSAPFNTDELDKKTGFVYAYFGSKNGLPDTHDLILLGQVDNERFGSSIDSGDFDGDGEDELFIGAYWSNVSGLDEAGRVYYYDFSNVQFRNPPPTLIKYPTSYFAGQAAKGWFGFDISVGDLNSDNIDDVAITSFPYGGDPDMASVSVKSPTKGAFLGASVHLEDFNGDGMVDISVGAPGINSSKSADEGSVYLIFGKETGFESVYNVTDLEIDSVIHGENSDDWFGYALKSLDFNNDGLNDLAIGSRYSDGDSSVNNGKVFILLGSADPYGFLRAVQDIDGEEVSRGNLVRIVLNSFDIFEKKSDYIDECYIYVDFCLFNFMAMSSFDDIQMYPDLILYPDVQTDNEYYEDINTATILGLVNGYMNETNSPFKADLSVTRIQALKMILGAADLVPTKYKFELIAMLGSYQNLVSQKSYFVDVNSEISHMWWYPRYVNFAVENGIVEDLEYFRPDDNITSQELNEMINSTLEYINSSNEEN